MKHEWREEITKTAEEEEILRLFLLKPIRVIKIEEIFQLSI